MSAPSRMSDQAMEEIVGRILRAGVVTAAGVVVVGALVYLARHHGETFGLGSFLGEPGDYTSVPGILRSAAGLSGRGIIQLGLLLLIATPVARVAFSVLGFAMERDRLYVAVTLAVLGFLCYSLLWA